MAEELAALMKRRNLEEAMMLGIMGDLRPSQEVMDVWRELLPGAKWVCQGHHWASAHRGVTVGYTAGVYTPKWAVDPAIRRLHGWNRPGIPASYFPRIVPRQTGLVFYRMIAEWNIEGKQHGVGRLAADFFSVKMGKRSLPLTRSYHESSWTNLNLREPWLAPGPEGPISTVRFEMGREGLQECEARIFVEKALIDETLRAKLGGKLATKCQAILDERTRHNMWTGFTRWGLCPGAMQGLYGLGYHWYASSGWQQRSEELFNAAAEVAKTLR